MTTSRQEHNKTRAELLANVREVAGQVDAGDYAIDGTPWRVTKGEGRHSGLTFLLKGGANRVTLREELAILSRIAASPQAARLAYGRLTNQCSVCGCHLYANEEIHERCKIKLGWD